jgi:glycosyltransferase involved in cell wall biosynthesis
MRLLLFHQGVDLYGSDRIFLDTVKSIKDAMLPIKMEVVLTSDGMLYDAFLELGITPVIVPFFVYRRSDFSPFSIKTYLKIIQDMLSLRTLYDSYDAVYISSVVSIAPILAAVFSPLSPYIHVHEIPGKLQSRILSFVLRLTHGMIIFNSVATRNAYKVHSSRSCVIRNGVREIPIAASCSTAQKINILHVGRFNDMKGQDLLVRAFDRLPKTQQSLCHVTFLGDGFRGDTTHMNEVKRLIDAHGLAENFTFVGFEKNISKFYEWATVVVIPSKRPESFGLVAAEAMSCGRLVIVSDVGALPELVNHGKTGLIFANGDVSKLAELLGALVKGEYDLLEIGRAAVKYYHSSLTIGVYSREITRLMEGELRKWQAS